MPSAEDTPRERRLLLVSVWASAGFAVGASVWGLLSGSAMIVFDGLYSFVGIGFSLLAVLALQLSRRGPSPDYPWGPEMWEPLVVVIKAVALAAMCVYAAVGGVHDLLTGGAKVATGWALAYAVLATVTCAVVTLVLRRGGRSDLVRSEAAEWLSSTLLSVGVMIGFIVAVALVAAGRLDLAAYVDPAMVVAASVLFLPVPAKLVAGGLREILSKAAPVDTLEALQGCIDAVGQRFGLGEAYLRAAKVGSRVDVEVDFVVGADSPVRTVADCDRVRQDLHDRLANRGYERSVVVAFTTDRKWAV